MDYSSMYGNDSVGALAGTLAAFSIIFVIIGLAAGILSIVIMWKIFKKAGKNGWESLIPIYNIYTLFEITWGNGWLFLLMFLAIIPVIGSIAVLVITILTMVKLSKAFGKSTGFTVGLIFLSVIFMAILAFDKSTYLGPVKKDNNQVPAPMPNNNFNSMPNQPINEMPKPAPQPITFNQPQPVNQTEMPQVNPQPTEPAPIAEPVIATNVVETPQPVESTVAPTPQPMNNQPVCSKCGTPLPPSTVFCPNCGNQANN